MYNTPLPDGERSDYGQERQREFTMTVIVVINGVLAVDSQVLQEPTMGLCFNNPMHGIKFFRSACGRAVGAKSAVVATQEDFEAIFAEYVDEIIKWEMLTAGKEDPGFCTYPASRSKKTLPKDIHGYVIMTQRSVLSFSKTGGLLHSNTSPNWIACTGADPDVTNTLIALGYDAETVVAKHREYSRYSSGDIHTAKAADLKPLVVEVVMPATKKPRSPRKATVK